MSRWPRTCARYALDDSVLIGERTCTEMSCADEVEMWMGLPFDILSVDACNACSPIPIFDGAGIARIHLQLVDRRQGAVDVAFEADIELNASAQAVELDADAVHVMGDLRDRERVYSQPIPRRILVLPDTLQPGEYTRRITAVDVWGNEGAYEEARVVVRLLDVVLGGEG